jgi:hypothetical protein
MWDWWERGSDHVYTEEDWTLDRSVQLNTYAYCKRESERLAYKLAEGKRCGTQLLKRFHHIHLQLLR